MCGTPGSAYPQPEPNATELPSSAPGRLKLIKLQAFAPSPTPTRAEEHIATALDCRPRAPVPSPTPEGQIAMALDCRPRAQAPSPTPTRAEHLAGLQIVRLRALARRRAPKRTSHAAGLQIVRLRALAHADSRRREPLPLALSALPLC